MENKVSFDELYEDTLLSHLEEMEGVRKLYITRAKKIIIYSYVIYFVSIALCLFMEWFIPFVLLLLIIPLIILGPIGLIVGQKRTAYKKLRPDFKKRILFKMLDSMSEYFEYKPHQRLSKTVINKSLIFDREIYQISGDDYTKCINGETIMIFSETEACSSHGYIEFKGIFMVAKFNKRFKSKTMVLPERAIASGIVTNHRIRRGLNGAKIIELEDPDFEKVFRVIGEDQIEGRYILTPDLMERLFNYQKKFKKKLSMAFIDDKLYMAIPTNKPVFEHNMSKPFTDKKAIKEHYDLYKSLTDIVEDLDLNTRIWV